MRKGLLYLPAILLIFFSLCGILRADDIIKKDRDRIKKYNERIKKYEKELKTIKVEEKSVFEKLRYIHTLIEKRQDELKVLTAGEEILAEKIKVSDGKVNDLTQNVANQKGQLKKRAVALYRLSDMQYLKILFSSSSYVDMIKRYKYLKLILNQDSELIAGYISDRTELEEKSNTLKKEKEKLDEIIKKVKNKEEEILAERNSKRIILLKVKREKSYYLDAIRELDEASKKLEGFILKLQKESAGSKISYKEKFKDFKKVLESPVDGEVISFFGKELVSRLDSYLFNNGIKISAEIGQDVKTVFSGEVLYSDWFRGYGKVVIVSHDGGYYTVYSHLSEFIKHAGDSVKRGEKIAKSGDSGSLSGPCLYFEIRYKGRSLNPLDWLEPTVVSSKRAL